jgi:hypothetical protein
LGETGSGVPTIQHARSDQGPGRMETRLRWYISISRYIYNDIQQKFTIILIIESNSAVRCENLIPERVTP